MRDRDEAQRGSAGPCVSNKGSRRACLTVQVCVFGGAGQVLLGPQEQKQHGVGGCSMMLCLQCAVTSDLRVWQLLECRV